MQTLIRIALVAAVAYAAFLVFLWLLQGRLIHLPGVPGRDLAGTPADVGLAFETVQIDTADGERLHGWFVPASEPRGVMLFLHGNAGNISHRLETLALFHQLDLSVLIIDYRGYGESTGTPGEAGLYRDGTAALDYLREARKVGTERVILAGRSLGAAVAARLAVEHRVGVLVLESAFTSVADMAMRQYPFIPAHLLVRHRYDTLAAVRRVNAPVLVIHSRGDEIVPFSHGRRVYEAAPEPKEFLALEGDHNSGFLMSREQYLSGLEAFLDRHL
ncbi:alpha/beta hydrolase [Ectothiorhodospiraceae bacterium WFHF3C12]|nr:alpha/beta hydrolase [Ectothiorhodospiraceae bacterium WFHF3C12]